MKQYLRCLNGNLAISTLIASSLFWSWVDSSLYGSFGMLDSSTHGFSQWTFSIPFLSSLIPLSISIFCSKNIPMQAKHPSFSIAATAAGILGTSLIEWGGYFGNTAIVVAGSILAGLYLGLGILFWGCICISQGVQRAFAHLAIVWTLDGIFNTLTAFAESTALVSFLIAAMPLLSHLICSLSKDQSTSGHAGATFESTTQNADRRKNRGLFSNIQLWFILTVAIVSLSNGLLSSSTSFFADSSIPESRLAYLILRSGTCLILLLRISLSSVYPSELLRDGIIVMAIGLAIGPLNASFNSNGFPNLVFSIGYTCFDLSIWIILAMISHNRSQEESVRHIALVQTINQSFIAFGSIMPMLLAFQPNTPSLKVFNLIAFLLLVTGICLLQKEKQYPEITLRNMERDALRTGVRKTIPSPIEHTPLSETDLDEFAHTYRLTKQEQRIVSLLQEGRSAPYIANRLYITQNTVKTHIRHIYEKTSVHNRQDLIDLIKKTPDN